MKIKNYIVLFVSALLVGCYEDKGNYDYKDIQEIKITQFERVSKTIGDTIRIEPKFDKDIPADASYISYKWRVDDEERPDDPNWNSRNFYWVADKLISHTNGFIELEVSDSRTGMKYLQRNFCAISGVFATDFSWTILSEDNGKSVLSFFKTEESEWVLNYSLLKIKSFKINKDLYSARNQGKELGRGPLSMTEHYCEDWNVAAGNYWMFNQSGGVDLDGLGFTQDVTLDQVFVNGVPKETIIQGGVCMQLVDVFYDQKGHLYSRVKIDKMLFNTGYFMPDPMRYKNEILEQCQPILGRYRKFTSRYTPIIDRKNHRLLAIIDGETMSYGNPAVAGAARIMEIPGEITAIKGVETPSKYIPLNNFEGYEVVSMQYIVVSRLPGFIILFKDMAGNLYLQEFVLERNYDNLKGTTMTVSRVKFYNLTGLGGVPSLMCTPPETQSRYSFFAMNNILYMLDRDNGNLTKYKEFNAKITALEGESLKNMFVAVGLEDGQFFIMNIVNAKNLPENERIMCVPPTNVRLGKIVQINFKINKGQSAWN